MVTVHIRASVPTDTPGQIARPSGTSAGRSLVSTEAIATISSPTLTARVQTDFLVWNCFFNYVPYLNLL